jgi:hypothetical protein
MIFSRFVEEDLALFERVNDSVETLEEYVTVMQPIVATLSSGPARKKRRAMRIRIVAAAATRPRLKELIGETQARLTDELRRLTEMAQKKEWLRDDLPAEVFAVLFQILIFGRALDDVSRDPVDEELWEASIAVLFADLLKR